MFRVRWDAWKVTARDRRKKLADETVALLSPLEGRKEGPSAAVNLLGHKGDLMLIHFRRTFDELSQIELRLARLGLREHLLPASSYVSIVELGLYEMTGKIHADLKTRGLQNGTDVFDRAFDEEITRQRERVIGRLFSEIPRRRHVCFYPMSKRRGESKNWYTVP